MANKTPDPEPPAGQAVRKRRPPHRSARRAAPSAPASAAGFDPFSAFPPAPPPRDDAHLLEPRETSFGGQPHVVRPLGPSDEDRLIEFFNSHTGETIRQRYGYRITEMTHERARHLVCVDPSRDVALGVFERAPDGGEILHAIGRYVLDADGRTAEMAFVVRETKRGLGICTALLRLLLEIARARGMNHLCAQVQADNAPMLGIFRRHCARMKPIPGADAMDVFVPTDSPSASMPSGLP
jgi:GNAT superfamily N-acetyltransferase